MEKYLNYLLADIAAATANVPVLTFEDSEEGPSFIPIDEEEKMARRERLGDWMGLRQEWFPPAGRLRDDQMSRLLEAMNQCLDAYNFIPHYPTGLPLRKRYEVLVTQLGKEVPILVHNPWQIDFCDYEPRTCPFGESFCQCKVYEQWLSREEEPLDEDAIEELMEDPHMPGFFYDDEEEEDFEEDEDFFFEEEEGYYKGEFDMEEELDEEDEDDPFLSGFSDFEPGPDDDGGRWN